MSLEAEKARQPPSPEIVEHPPVKKTKLNPNPGIFDQYDYCEGRRIYWDSDKDLQKSNPTMFDTELLNVVLNNQAVLDTKINFIYKFITSGGLSNASSSRNVTDRTLAARPDVVTVINRNKAVMVEQINFSQIPIRNNDEFLSLESELKENAESVVSFEIMLEHLGSPENYSEFIKRITSKLFTPNFMEQLGWAQIGLGGLQLKETTIKESIYNVFAKKYDGINEDILNEKFSQHFRSFRLHRNKVSLVNRCRSAIFVPFSLYLLN